LARLSLSSSSGSTSCSFQRVHSLLFYERVWSFASRFCYLACWGSFLSEIDCSGLVFGQVTSPKGRRRRRPPRRRRPEVLAKPQSLSCLHTCSWNTRSFVRRCCLKGEKRASSFDIGQCVCTLGLLDLSSRVLDLARFFLASNITFGRFGAFIFNNQFVLLIFRRKQLRK